MPSFNPYHAWLGLKPQIKNPHHFQLLGLPSSVSDPREIRRAALARLELLNQVDPGEHASLLDALRKKIALASKVLSNPESRVTYTRKLLEVAGKQQRKSAAAPRENDSDSQPVPLPVAKPDREYDAAPSESPPSDLSTPGIPTDPGAGDPMVIPLAVPISDASMPLLETSVAIPLENTPQVTEPEPVRIRPLARKKKSLLLPIMSLLFFAIGITGLVLLTVNFNAIFGRPDSSTVLPVLPAIPPHTGDAEAPADINLPNTSAIPAGENENETRSESVTSNIEPNELSLQEDPAGMIDVSFNDEIRLRRRVSAARRRLLNRKPDAAMKLIADAEAIVGQLNEAGPPKGQASSKHQFLFGQIQATKDVNLLLSGFWDQVYNSSQQLGGGQQIKVGETYVALISVTNTNVRIKTSGTTVDYRFQDIPSALAIAMAEAVDRDDQPLWRMQKAALYAVHSEEDSVYRQNALDLVVQSEADNHNGTAIRNFLDFDPKKYGIPAEPINTGNSANQLRQRVDEIRASLRISDDQRQLDKDSAHVAIAKAERMLDSVEGENALERAAILRLLQDLAVVAGEVDLAFEYAQESTIWDLKMEEVDQIAILTQLADAKLEQENARRWVQMCLAECKRKELSSSNREKVQALLSKAKNLAETEGMADLLVSIKRLVD